MGSGYFSMSWWLLNKVSRGTSSLKFLGRPNPSLNRGYKRVLALGALCSGRLSYNGCDISILTGLSKHLKGAVSCSDIHDSFLPSPCTQMNTDNTSCPRILARTGDPDIPRTVDASSWIVLHTESSGCVFKRPMVG